MSLTYSIGKAVGYAAAQDVQKRIDIDTALKNYAIAARNGGGYAAAQAYAVRLGEIVGKLLTERFKEELTNWSAFDAQGILDILAPVLQKCSARVSELCQTVQNGLNRDAQVGLKALKAAPDPERLDNLAAKFAGYDDPVNGLWLLGEPLINWLQHIVDESVRINAEAQVAAGLAPVVRRIADSAECPFCSSRAGKYRAPFGNDLFQRHERCRCLILLEPHRARAGSANLSEKPTGSERSARIARVLEAEKRRRT